MDESGGDGSTSGDFRGWYGHNGDGNPPASANATISSNISTRFDFDLVIAPDHRSHADADARAAVVRSPAPAQLGDPPAQADEQEPPVLEELGRFALERVPDELQRPADDERHPDRPPQPGHGDRDQRGDDG